LKSQLANYATDVIQLEKEKGELQQALLQSRQALQDADTAKQQAQDAGRAAKEQLDATIRKSNNVAYVVLAGLAIVLLAYGAVFAGKWRQAWLARRESNQKLLKLSQQLASGAEDEESPLSGNVLERELEKHVANINSDPETAPTVAPQETPATAPDETPAAVREETPAAS
jgi:hypothetical protein